MQPLKTVLPDSIDTIEDAKKFLLELYNNGESYHPEDDSRDIIWASGVKPTPGQFDQLNVLMFMCVSMIGFDACEYLLELSNDLNDEPEEVSEKPEPFQTKYLVSILKWDDDAMCDKWKNAFLADTPDEATDYVEEQSARPNWNGHLFKIDPVFSNNFSNF